MNFLAHAYLSFNDEETLVGNMISDFVKGKKKLDFSVGIQRGIALHRAIDAFTDQHPATREAKKYLQEAVGLYSGPFVDIIYDHFLASDDKEFAEDHLEEFCRATYKTLNEYSAVLPLPFSAMLPFMTSQNWLYNYKNLWGTERSFGGLARRAQYLQSEKEAFASFLLHYSSLQKCYNDFFPSVKEYARKYMNTL